MLGITKTHVAVALAALVAYAIVAFVQREVRPVPMIGKYLPGG